MTHTHAQIKDKTEENLISMMTSKSLTRNHLDELALEGTKMVDYGNKYSSEHDAEESEDGEDLSFSNTEEGSSRANTADKDQVMNQLGGNESKWIVGSKLCMLFILGFPAAASTAGVYLKNKQQEEKSFNTRVSLHSDIG